MPLQLNASLRYVDYTPLDSGVELHFFCDNPGGGQPGDYSIVLTDAEIATMTTLPLATALIRTKLQRKYRNNGFVTALETLKGQSLVI